LLQTDRRFWHGKLRCCITEYSTSLLKQISLGIFGTSSSQYVCLILLKTGRLRDIQITANSFIRNRETYTYTLSEQILSDICKQILDTDEFIRFAGIANRMGNLEATTYRQGLVPLMTRDETSQYAIQAVLRAATRQDFEANTGRLQYSIGKYEKLIRATVPILLSNSDYEGKFYLLLSFDVGSDAKSIIENKVIPCIEKNKEIFSV
jgi:hypothetical protein